ncbi:putative methyltransferase-domain-containing protein [Tricladium varicosporioides]|nr:putative methyltransferase-domain-containing protein [Hymenoscyphus varicosporioides]
MAIKDELSLGAWKQLNRFCRQYLQLQSDLTYPDEQYLADEEFQATLHKTLFADDATQHPPPQRYRLRVLKELTERIEHSILDWDKQGLSDDLMSCLATLLASPLQSETASAQQKAYVTYTLSSLPAATNNVTPTVTLLEARNVVASAGTTGLRTWEAALHLGNFLCQSPELIHGKSVLDLGAGTGYLSLLCAKHLGASYTLVTDGSSDVVEGLITNVYLNDLQESNLISASQLIWGQALPTDESNRTFSGHTIDVVLGTDLIYYESGIPALIATFGDLADLFPDIIIIIAAPIRNEQTFQTFVDACAKEGFSVKVSEFEMIPKDEQQGPFYSASTDVNLCFVSRT